jgi:GT2 family glycosyltransferase
MNNNLPDISVVVVTWNSKAYTIECLESLQKAGPHPAMEIVVVDNASSDGTAEAIAEHYPSVRLIRNAQNVGFARANNQGLQVCRGRYVCLVNSDVVVPEDCMPRVLSYMDANPDIGLLGPKMLTPTGEAGYSVMRFPTAWNTLCCALGFSGFMFKEFNYERTEDVEVLTGWFWVARRSALEQVGGLDEQFFMYGEDIDWSQRFHIAGWRVVYYAGAEALHYGGASSKNAPARFYIEMRRANLQYYRKYHGHLSRFAYSLAVWSHELARVLAYGAIFVLRQSQRAEASFKIDRSLRCMSWLAKAGTGSQAPPLPQA